MSGRVLLFLTLLSMSSCQKEEAIALADTQIETQAFYSTEATKAEVTIEIFNVKNALAEVGVAISEKPEPSTADRTVSINNIAKNQSIRLVIDNLTKGKTYYARSFFKNLEAKIIYGNSFSLIQNFDERWSKVESPPSLAGEEYVLTENIVGDQRFGGLPFTVVDPVYNRGVKTYFFPNFYQWDPRFFNLDKTAFQVRFNEIVAPFTSGGESLLLRGGGYQKQSNGERFYMKDLAVIQGSYRFSPQYPGANAEVTSFGLGKYVYVIENLANGKLWLFDYENLKWIDYQTLPFAFDAKYYSYVVNGKIYIFVEPKDLKAPLGGFYEFIPETKVWKKLADYKGDNRRRSSGFVYRNKIYFGAGQSADTNLGLRDFWEYDPATNEWKEAFTYPGAGTLNLAMVSYEGFVFAGFGQSVIVSANKGEKFKNMTDFWSLRLR